MVSIVLPIYNGEKYIKESIESILSQTYKDLELIVIDDCSTDNTNIIVREYANKDNRIRLCRNEHNLKLPASLNIGFSKAKGNYLTWTSDDNIYKDNAVERLVNVLEKDSSVDFVFSAMEYINENGDLIKASDDVKTINEIYYKNIIGASFMYRRCVYEFIGEYNTEKFLVEDYDYWLRIARKYKIKYLNEPLYLYRVHTGSLTETKNRQMLDAKIALLHEELKIMDLNDDVKRNVYRELAVAAFSLDRYKQMKQYIISMKNINSDIRDLPFKVRVAGFIGGRTVMLMKRIYRVTKNRRSFSG